MKILFVVEEMNKEHLSVMSLSGILKKAGYQVDIAQAKYSEIKRRLDNNLTVLAYSAVWSNMDRYLRLNLEIKEGSNSNIFSVFGGHQPSCYPEEVIHRPGVDGVCVGEGDYALLDLAKNLAENKPVTNIPNWWIKQGGEVFRNPQRPLIKDLDSLPFVDRALFPRHNTIFLNTSRGCPYECSFCLGRSEFRRRSIDNVIRELQELKDRIFIRFIHFSDLTFNLSLSWLREFSEKYKREIGLPFYCFVRADLVTEECIKYLKDAGCFSVGMGIETANDYLRNEVLKKGISKEQIVSAARLIKKRKVRLMTFNMIGIPCGTLADDLDTLKLNIQCRPDYAKAIILFPYKTTDIYDSLARKPEFRHHADLASEDDSQDLQAKNLRNLFALATEFPFLLKLLPLLTKLPLAFVYSFLNLVWKKYCIYFRIWNEGFFSPGRWNIRRRFVSSNILKT